MKKWIVGLLVAAVLAVCSVYVFIPSVIVVSSVRYVRSYQNTVTKVLQDSALFNKWWQANTETDGKNFSYKGFDYHVFRGLSNLAQIQISSNRLSIPSMLISLNVYLDSSALQWNTQLQASANPIDRIKQYNEATALKESMEGIMDKLKKYFDNSANIYGIEVKEIQAKDSLLISTKIKTTEYPGIAQVYQQVQKLQDYATAQGAAPTNSPMLNVTMLGKNDYQVMVGLPINKVVQQTADIRIKHMPYGGNMLTANIKGGSYTIQEGIKKLNEYYMDSKRTSPAIPYEMMITDRMKESDTTKWETRLYYPVM